MVGESMGAVVDADGVILQVNEAWQDFFGGPDQASTGTGVKYQDACGAAGDSAADLVSASIGAVVGGALPGPISMRLPRVSPTGASSFQIVISERLDPAGRRVGAEIRVSRQDDVRTTGFGAAPDPALAPGELLEALGQAVVVTDPGGIIVFWNSAAERLYGWAESEVLGRDITEVTVPQMSNEVAGEIMEAMRSGVPWSGCFPVRRRDGTVFPALVTDSGVYRDGVLVGVIGEFANLSVTLQPLMERSRDAVILLTADGTITYASAAVGTLFGWRADDLIGQPLMGCVHQDDQNALVELLREEQRDGTHEGSVDVRVRSGVEWVWVEAVLTNLLGEPMVRSLVCNLRHSERLAELAERERLSQTMHLGVLQDLFAAGLDLDSLRLRATPSQRPRIEAAIELIGRSISAIREAVNPRDEGQPQRR